MSQGQPETCQTEESSGRANALSDRDLVAEVLRNERKAAAEFVARYADHVYGYIRRRMIPRADLVEDLVQEVFLAAWESLEKFKGDSSLRSWLLGIARHKVEDHYRKRLRELQLQEEGEDSSHEPACFDDLEEALAKDQAGQKNARNSRDAAGDVQHHPVVEVLGKTELKRHSCPDWKNRKGH